MPNVHVSLPFPEANGLSKNRTKRVGKGRMYLSQEGQLSRELLERELHAVSDSHAWVDNRMAIRILLVKTMGRRDAANFVDEVCDAVEKITGVNDSWYSVLADWTVGCAEVIHVWVDQEEGLAPSKVCSKCHQVLPVEEFTTRSGGCTKCLVKYRKDRYDARKRQRLAGGQNVTDGNTRARTGPDPGSRSSD